MTLIRKWHSPGVLEIVGISGRAEPPAVSWAHTGAGARVPLLAASAVGHALLVLALAGAALVVVDVDLRVAVFRLLLAGALARQVPFNCRSCADRVPLAG